MLPILRRFTKYQGITRLYSENKFVDHTEGRESKVIKIGDESSHTHKFTEEDLEKFAQVVGDYNPLHFSEEFAKEQGIFKKRVVHGMLLGGLISTVAGTKLPGPGSIYLNQTFKFEKPAYLGDTVTAKVKLTQAFKSPRSDKKNIFVFETICVNEETQQVLVKGEAKVFHPLVHVVDIVDE
ncbi:3-hydroxyacyl-thioester dehydratase [Acrasis kona]|uniref:3-hydroxyacyl-thioester dehydratase n=1 Tax=Acrasis kona TaxID=1008807 RepID=A0AAW2YXF8_9EUKA